LQRTIWRINRAIAQCSSVSEALGVIDEMKAAGLTTANEGMFWNLLTPLNHRAKGNMIAQLYRLHFPVKSEH
jgi:hypothetical protein